MCRFNKTLSVHTLAFCVIQLAQHHHCFLSLPSVQTVKQNLFLYQNKSFIASEEDSPTELAKRLESELAGSLLALWQQRLTQSTSFEGEIDIEYASESESDSSGPPSPIGDDPSLLPRPQYGLSNHGSGVTDQNGNRPPTNSLLQIKLPVSASNDDGTSSTLEEIRSKLRKTKFDYTSDTKVRICEATPQLDYRSVLKKKGNV
ncbi:hypothetical protein Btru_047939 [Bulinus truncatus]|nr:hypothetical protein Btru_047939 [Bulinus truncatus]